MREFLTHSHKWKRDTNGKETEMEKSACPITVHVSSSWLRNK